MQSYRFGSTPGFADFSSRVSFVSFLSELCMTEVVSSQGASSVYWVFEYPT